MSMMQTRDFERFCRIVYEQSGISLQSGKEALVASRVSKRLRALGLSGYDEYLALLEQDGQGDEIVRLIDAISTNVTHFFREPDHFELLHSLLREWAAKGQQRFRLWSAASSTGEEPYSMAMTAADALEGKGCDLRILATDISTRALGVCREARYGASKVSHVPAEYRHRYMRREGKGDSAVFEVKPELRAQVLLRRLNLARPPLPMRGPLDVVFCRNVMIYFDRNVREGLLREITRLLRPGGYLCVGHTESLSGMKTSLRSIRPSVFIKE